MNGVRRPARLLTPTLALVFALVFGLRALRAGGIGRLARTGRTYTVAERLEQYGATVRERWAPAFASAGVAYPPKALVLVGLKYEKRLEVAAGDGGRPLRFLRSYAIKAASGRLGPKLREGDEQVPEGMYRIVLLNPNSLFHLSLRVSYPNDFDRDMARRDKRTRLGGDIMIHGNAVSIGCLAMGDEAAEDLFVLAADTGLRHVRVILSPVDFRVRKLPEDVGALPSWTKVLYAVIQRELAGVPGGG